MTGRENVLKIGKQNVVQSITFFFYSLSLIQFCNKIVRKGKQSNSNIWPLAIALLFVDWIASALYAIYSHTHTHTQTGHPDPDRMHKRINAEPQHVTHNGLVIIRYRI